MMEKMIACKSNKNLFLNSKTDFPPQRELQRKLPFIITTFYQLSLLHVFSGLQSYFRLQWADAVRPHRLAVPVVAGGYSLHLSHLVRVIRALVSSFGDLRSCGGREV